MNIDNAFSLAFTSNVACLSLASVKLKLTDKMIAKLHKHLKNSCHHENIQAKYILDSPKYFKFMHNMNSFYNRLIFYYLKISIPHTESYKYIIKKHSIYVLYS